MSKNTKFVLGIVILAFFCSSIPIITMFIVGYQGQNGVLLDQLPKQLDQPITFVSVLFTKLANESLFIPLLGLLLSLYFRQRNPKKFHLTAISFTIFILGEILIPMLTTWLEINYAQQGVSLNQRATGYSVVNCASTFVYITAWIILLFAIFSHKFDTNNATPKL
jgi:hypothetical protein